jgi:ABC-type transport system involved in multi-copper enzyme maturation permease subunit
MNWMDEMTIDRQSLAQSGSRPRALTRRMVNAEFLKVRKRRGLVALSAFLTVGVVTLVLGILAILHAQNPARYGPAGGVSNLSNALGLVATLGSVAAIIVGATMGAGDVQAGVFRDLASTGRSRIALFAARIPGGLGLVWPLAALGWLISCGATVIFAGNLAHPTLGLMLQGGGWVLLATTSMYLMALGVASLTGLRSTTIGVLLAWQFVVSQLLLQISALGAARQVIQMGALTRLIPDGLLSSPRDPVSATMSAGVAFLVVVAWAALPLAAGAWRTETRDA